MYKNSLLANSVRFALVSGAAMTAFTAPAVFAADEQAADKVERIEVTGSRIKRSDLEGASPVTTITAEDMKVEGNFTVADALRNSNLNSFGSFSERSGSSAQSQATINLRGAGSSRTLVLIDGKRFPGSPTLGGASANLNAIPMAAVERIEILTDGASSTYGSDAIAGVVNIIMKKNFQGVEFNVGGGSRERDGGLTSKEFSVVAGYEMDKGNITFAFDHQDRKGISDADREYTAPWMKDLDGDGVIQAYNETDGWSYFGATVLAPDFSEAQASLLCDDLAATYGDNVFKRVAADADWSEGSEYCMYAYGNVSYNKASVDRNTVYVDANYEIAEDVEWFGRVMVTQNKSFGRYAPPAAAWESMSADNPHNPYGEDNAYGLFRWVGIGTRDGNVDDYNQDYLTGLRGSISAWNDATWEFYYHYNKADNKSIGEYYLSYSGLAYNEANDIDLGSEDGINNMKATTLTQDRATFHQYNGGIGFDAFELPGGEVAHYFGMEYFEQDYASIYDAQSEAGLIGGSAGNSAGGDRQVWAAFYEAAMPLTDTVELNIAARYDDYSDFGDNVAPKASVRWQALDNLVVRASYSEAFRAPALDQLYAATSFSAEDSRDIPLCTESGGASGCDERQIDTYYSANSNLGPEQSEYLNLGVAWDIVDNIGVKVDYFQLDITDVISTRSTESVIEGIHNGSITPTDTFYVERAPTTDGTLGRVLEVGTGYDNGKGFNIEGLDVAFNANFETSIGDFNLNWTNSFVLSYEEEKTVDGELKVVDTSGENDQPDYKSVFTAVYSMGDHSFGWNMNYTASTEEERANGDIDKRDDWLIHNINYTYNAGAFGAIQLGVNNLTDEDPVLSSLGKFENPELYNNYGREFTARYTLKF
ncbi:TonB-dependent receptor [Shewanella sp. cp20]|uniref:TonB-dependent receptor n=1 Tax=Shewanella sp. cp20 TaxID=1521167 RepID=UPI0005A14765|nr:TonB-dependent receptor [Shewanella sp. cp20]KIO37411.1 TonB-dependent receptor [Shewanella sp. cp20]